MGKLISVTNVSLDGYIEDERGEFAWFPVDDEVFAHHTALMRSASVLLYGRRLYETMAVWETDAQLAAQSPSFAEFADAWQAPAKIVYSTRMSAPTTARTSIQRTVNRAEMEAVKSAAGGDLLIGGADLAAQAIQASVVDEIQLYLLPLTVGGGKPGLPTTTRLDLELLEQRQFGNGVVFLRYAVRTPLRSSLSSTR